jgi:hypothetical protein
MNHGRDKSDPYRRRNMPGKRHGDLSISFFNVFEPIFFEFCMARETKINV